MKFILLALALFTFSCEEEDTDSAENCYAEPSGQIVCSDSSAANSSYLGSQDDHELFLGYIGGAFEIVVDGVEYEDTEEYYTHEMIALEDKLAEAGYPGVAYEFDAEVGFSDFWRNTSVNIQSVGNVGFQDKATVDPSNGSFEMKLPLGAFGDYKIKSIKRIGVILETGERFCYNLKGIEDSYELSPTGLPVLINNFETSLTTYECEGGSSGLDIPKQI